MKGICNVAIKDRALASKDKEFCREWVAKNKSINYSYLFWCFRVTCPLVLWDSILAFDYSMNLQMISYLAAQTLWNSPKISSESGKLEFYNDFVMKIFGCVMICNQNCWAISWYDIRQSKVSVDFLLNRQGQMLLQSCCSDTLLAAQPKNYFCIRPISKLIWIEQS